MEQNQYRSLSVKKHIESVDDVREFFTDLKNEGLMIHPEDTFGECYQPEWNLSDQMLYRLDGTLNDCHEMCDENGVDICEIALEVMGWQNEIKYKPNNQKTMEIKDELKNFVVERTARYNVKAKSAQAVELAAAGGVIFGNLTPDSEHFSVRGEAEQQLRDRTDFSPRPLQTRPTKTQILIAMGDGTYLTKEQWNAGSYDKGEVLGIAVITPCVQFVLALNEQKAKWSNDTDTLITKRHSEAEAYQIISGYDDTKAIVEAQTDEEDTAAKLCWNYGYMGKQWYLPCLLELAAACANRCEINDLMVLVGGTPLSTGGHWSSTEYSTNNSWYFNFGDGYSSYSNYKGYSYVVRPAVAI